MTKEVFTEEPEEELWRSLLQYSYKANIKRYFDKNGIQYESGNEDIQSNSTNRQSPENTPLTIDILSDHIAGAILQAYEYYNASNNVSLQVRPLLLYYGTTNLFYALTVLKTGKVPIIDNHGMHIKPDIDNTFIADTCIHFDSFNSGGIHRFVEALGYNIHLCSYGEWKLYEFLDSIAEIKEDFNNCYPDKKSHILMLDVIKTPDTTIQKTDVKTVEEANEMFGHIEQFPEAYLRPQLVQLKGDCYFILQHKLNHRNIEKISYSGQPYLMIAHDKGTKQNKQITIPAEVDMFICLFALGSLCRYHPEIWNPFVVQDTSGEKLLVEKLLFYSRRILPNIVLNHILDQNISFVADKYSPDDRNHFVGEHEVQEIVRREVRKQLKIMEASSIIN